MADELDEIRSRISIVDLVGQVVRLKRSGKNWTGLCPFHSDKRPSFSVSDQSGYYRCYSCGESGSIFDWVMKTQNLTFGEAVKVLADQAGVVLSKQAKPEQKEVKLGRLAAMESALKFFQAELARSNAAREYCKNRGLGDEVIATWEIGYAPDVSDAMARHLLKTGLRLEECKDLFLVDQASDGSYYDKFRGRLMFPIRDERGSLVAFGGRLLGDGHPKYINSGDTPLYRKSRVLYGLNIAKNALRNDAPVVLCEGYLDVIACHQAGVTTAVASLGTAATELQAQLIKRYTNRAVILYDSDPAGEKAAQRASEVFGAEGLQVKVSLMPKGEDPDTLLRTAGPDAVKMAAEKGIHPVEFKLIQIQQRHHPADEAFWREAIEALTLCKNDLELRTYSQKLAPQVPDLKDPAEAARWLRSQATLALKAKKRQETPETPEVKGRPVIGMKSVEADLFRAYLQPQFRKIIHPILAEQDLFLTLNATDLARAILAKFGDTYPSVEGPILIAHLEDSGVAKLLADLEMTTTSRITHEWVQESISLLRSRKEDRDRNRIRLEGTGDERLDEINKRLRRKHEDSES
ncbi:MAG: DNA primase [Fimbriimonadaceae bacterium]